MTIFGTMQLLASLGGQAASIAVDIVALWGLCMYDRRENLGVD